MKEIKGLLSELLMHNNKQNELLVRIIKELDKPEPVKKKKQRSDKGRKHLTYKRKLAVAEFVSKIMSEPCTIDFVPNRRK